MPPPPPPRTTTVEMPTTSGSGSIPSTTLNTFPSIQNASGDPFSYGMLGFDCKSVLTYSTLHTIGLGLGRFNAPLQGTVAGITSLFNTILYGGGHIPPPSTSLRGNFQ
jgi:hypothetical protein